MTIRALLTLYFSFACVWVTGQVSTDKIPLAEPQLF